MSDIEEARRLAEENFLRNQQAQMATEQQLRDAELRNAYNAELARQRQLEDERIRQQQG